MEIFTTEEYNISKDHIVKSRPGKGMEKSEQCQICDDICAKYLCEDCFYKMVINKTNTKKIYKLNDGDLESLESFRCATKTNRGQFVNLYFLKDVRMKAIEKKFGIQCDTIETYHDCLALFAEKYKVKL